METTVQAFFFFDTSKLPHLFTKRTTYRVHRSKQRRTTSKERIGKATRSAAAAHHLLQPRDEPRTRAPPSKTTTQGPAGNRHPRNGSTPSPEALLSRRRGQLHRAGTDDEEAASAGAPRPRAPPAPDPWPTPRIGHHHSTLPRSSRLEAPPDPPPARKPPRWIWQGIEARHGSVDPRVPGPQTRRHGALPSAAAGEDAHLHQKRHRRLRRLHGAVG